MDTTQKQINVMLGVSDEVFAKYNPGPEAVASKKIKHAAAGLTETQLMINKMLGISEEVWLKYNTKGKTQEARRDGIVTIIPKLGPHMRKEV